MKRYLLIGCGNSRDKRFSFPANDEFGEPGSPEKDFSAGELVTADFDDRCAPDVVIDLDQLPYPWATNEFDEVHAYEVLEHCGTQGDAKFFFAQFAELWRILKPNGYLCVSVPMWDSEVAWGVPDHKRVLTPGIFGFLDQSYYENVGKPKYGDYRHLLGNTNFKPIAKQETGDTLHVVMQAIKPLA